MIIEIATIFVLILLTGFFAMSEMAIVSSRKARLRHEAEQGRKAYRLALQTAEHPALFLSTIQVVISLVTTLAGAFGGATIAVSLEATLDQVSLLHGYAAPISVGLVVIGTTFVSVILGELVPKNLALSRPEMIAAAVIRPIRFLTVLFAPLSKLLSGITSLIIRLLGAHRHSDPVVTEEEVRVLIAQGNEAGIFEDREREMFEGVLSLGDRRVTTLMTPRTEVVSIDLREPLESIRASILENARYGYLPVVDGDFEKVVGMLPVKDCLAAMAMDGFTDPRSYVLQAPLIPETFTALKALAALKGGEVKTSLILDEYGSLAGIVSLSDIVSSIVGELPLTGDGDEPEMIRREDGSYLVDGALLVEDFYEVLDMRQPPRVGDYDTIAGLLLDRMGTIPKAGEKCRIGDCLFEVMDMDGHRIDKLLVYILPQPAPENATDTRA